MNKPRLIKKDEIKPAAPHRPKRVAKPAKLGNVIKDPRAAFAALFERLIDRDQEIAGGNEESCRNASRRNPACTR